jgi:hypothetical protein
MGNVSGKNLGMGVSGIWTFSERIADAICVIRCTVSDVWVMAETVGVSVSSECESESDSIEGAT